MHTSVNAFIDCDFPQGFNYVVIFYLASLIVLFSNFYYKAYITGIAKKRGKKVSSRKKDNIERDDFKRNAKDSDQKNNTYVRKSNRSKKI